MLLQIPDVLSKHDAEEARQALDAAEWVDGRVTAGHQSGKAKHNRQLPEDHPLAKKLGDGILRALERQPVFLSAALPHRVFPPLFNCYGPGESFGTHVDNAIRQKPLTHERIRTDLSATLFLSDPNSYEGGELLIEDNYGMQRVKLAAGSMVLYPASSLHRVSPVTQGVRVASFFWIQSMVRDDSVRTMLFDLDMAIQKLQPAAPDHPSLIQLTGIYHNLLRRYAEV